MTIRKGDTVLVHGEPVVVTDVRSFAPGSVRIQYRTPFGTMNHTLPTEQRSPR